MESFWYHSNKQKNVFLTKYSAIERDLICKQVLKDYSCLSKISKEKA